MYANVSYLNNSVFPFADDSQPLIVGSCGHYRFSGDDLFHTRRPGGRQDYQLLYVASGTGEFLVDGKTFTVSPGEMVLYRPWENQDYVYRGEDKPEVFWIHFTGSQVEEILRGYGIAGGIFPCGNYDIYGKLFHKMIGELKTCTVGFEELLAMYLRQIFVQVRRNSQANQVTAEPKLRAEMEQAIRYFYEHYMEPIRIEQYARSHGMSVSWFLRCFKLYTRQSPMQYITSLRINNAANLLENTEYNVTEIAAMVGYENPLYFSRIFRKVRGVSPSQYRKRMLAEGGLYENENTP